MTTLLLSQIATVIAAGILLLSSIIVLTLSWTDISLAVENDEKSVAVHTFIQWITRFVAKLLLFFILLLGLLAKISPIIQKFFINHPPFGFYVVTVAFIILSIGEFTELPWRYRFLHHYGVLGKDQKSTLSKDSVLNVDNVWPFIQRLSDEDIVILRTRLMGFLR